MSQYLVAPLWHFSCQKHSFLKYPIPEIPGDFENKSGMDRVLKKTSGSGRVSGTRWALLPDNTRLIKYMMKIPVPDPYPIRPEIFFPIPEPDPAGGANKLLETIMKPLSSDQLFVSFTIWFSPWGRTTWNISLCFPFKSNFLWDHLILNKCKFFANRHSQIASNLDNLIIPLKRLQATLANWLTHYYVEPQTRSSNYEAHTFP